MAVSPGIKSPGMFATRTDLSGTPATPRVRLGRLAPCVKIFKIILSVVFVYYKLQYFIFKSNRYNILHYVNIHTCCPPNCAPQTLPPAGGARCAHTPGRTTTYQPNPLILCHSHNLCRERVFLNLYMGKPAGSGYYHHPTPCN